MNTKLLKTLIATSALAVAGSALAAGQGSPGIASSTASSVLTVNVPNLVVINGVDDITVAYDGTAASLTTNNTSDLCVASLGDGAYTVTATTANGSYVLDNGSETIAYTLDWNGGALGYNTPVADATGETVLGNCPADNSGTGTTLTLNVTEANVTAVTTTGGYTDTVTLLVAPQ